MKNNLFRKAAIVLGLTAVFALAVAGCGGAESAPRSENFNNFDNTTGVLAEYNIGNGVVVEYISPSDPNKLCVYATNGNFAAGLDCIDFTPNLRQLSTTGEIISKFKIPNSDTGSVTEFTLASNPDVTCFYADGDSAAALKCLTP